MSETQQPDTAVFAGTHLERGSYFADAKAMEIEFSDGSRYRYDGVPDYVWDELKATDAPGSYFHRHVKGRFPYRRT